MSLADTASIQGFPGIPSPDNEFYQHTGVNACSPDLNAHLHPNDPGHQNTCPPKLQAVPRAPDLLDAMAATFRERNAVYKDNWITCGQVFQILFPDGVKVETQAQHEMFGILYQIVGKLTRFAGSGCTHADSIHDLAVYSAIAEHLLHKHGDAAKIGV